MTTVAVMPIPNSANNLGDRKNPKSPISGFSHIFMACNYGSQPAIKALSGRTLRNAPGRRGSGGSKCFQSWDNWAGFTFFFNEIHIYIYMKKLCLTIINAGFPVNCSLWAKFWIGNHCDFVHQSIQCRGYIFKFWPIPIWVHGG